MGTKPIDSLKLYVPRPALQPDPWALVTNSHHVFDNYKAKFVKARLGSFRDEFERQLHALAPLRVTSFAIDIVGEDDDLRYDTNPAQFSVQMSFAVPHANVVTTETMP